MVKVLVAYYSSDMRVSRLLKSFRLSLSQFWAAISLRGVERLYLRNPNVEICYLRKAWQFRTMGIIPLNTRYVREILSERYERVLYRTKSRYQD